MTFYEYPSTPVKNMWIYFHPESVPYLQEYSPLWYWDWGWDESPYQDFMGLRQRFFQDSQNFCQAKPD